MTDHTFTERQNDLNKEAWSALRGQGYALDYNRAVFLLRAKQRGCYDSLRILGAYLVSDLGEFRGKRVQSLLRMVSALEEIPNRDTWLRIGGAGVVLLSRAPRNKRGRIMSSVAATMRRTGRTCVSRDSFRQSFRRCLTAEEYSEALLEKPRDRTDWKAKALTYRKQAGILVEALLEMLNNGTIRRRDLPPAAQVILNDPNRSAA